VTRHCGWFGEWSGLGAGGEGVCDLVVGTWMYVGTTFHNVVLLVEVLERSVDPATRDSGIEMRALRGVDCAYRLLQVENGGVSHGMNFVYYSCAVSRASRPGGGVQQGQLTDSAAGH